MNSLSWMIYAAEVAGRLAEVAVGMTIMAGIGYGGALIATGMAVNDGDMAPETAASWRRLPAVLFFIFLPISVFAPSANAIYMIAASEAGETIVTSPEAREVFNDLKTIIKSKLKEQIPKT